MGRRAEVNGELIPRNQEKSQTLSEQQRLAVQLLASGKNGRQVAEQLEIGEDTVSRWRNHDADFKAAINAILRDVEDSNQCHLRRLASNALLVLEEIMQNPEESASDRIKAAGLILDRLSLSEPVGSTSPAVVRGQQRFQILSESMFLVDQIDEA